MADKTKAGVQWKGTDACIDLWCECGEHSHFDGYFASQLRCPSCDRVWLVPYHFELTPGDESEPSLTATDDDEDES